MRNRLDQDLSVGMVAFALGETDAFVIEVLLGD
jgi:hypothetical protein